MGLLTSKNYLVHYYEIDSKKRALISTIINYLMDICTFQSDSAGVGIDYLLSNNKGWILTQWKIKIHRYPLYEEQVKVSTKANSFYKYYAYRKHFIEDKEGNLLVEGESTWLMVDLVKRKPLKLSEDMFTAYGINPEDKERFKTADFKHLDHWDYSCDFKVRYSDIDTNNHVNNVKYVSWIMETIPLDLVLNYEMRELTILYKKEISYGHIVNVNTTVEKTPNGYLCKHNILNEAGEDLTLAETIWI